MNNNITDDHNEKEQTNVVFNIDYAKLAAEVIRQHNSIQNVQLDNRENVADNRTDTK